MTAFNGRVGLVQRVVPSYRAPFFDALGAACPSGLAVFAGKPKPGEMIKTVETLDQAQLSHAKNLHLFDHSLYICIQIGLLRWLKAWDPDVLIVEANPRYLRTPAAVRWMHTRGRPVIGWGLGAPLLSGPLASMRHQRRTRFIRQFDALITYSQAGGDQYAHLGYAKERIFVAVNAVTPPPAHPLPVRPAPAEDLRRRVLFVGRLQERKQIHNLLAACAQLPDALQPELVIVGDGPDRARLQALAQELYPQATFTGALFGDALEAQFRGADLFVLPGTGGLAMQQAMSFGLPVIAAEADGTQADLVRPRNGWQIPPNDVSALQTALHQALSDIAALRKMGAESYRIVSEEVNLDKMVAVFLQALKRTTP
ncbi:MAG: glycosyltransferase family 4 protein [Brevefilum sp.]|nr:glycosyltransferase family 4 protein [Brevefilum sp.]